MMLQVNFCTTSKQGWNWKYWRSILNPNFVAYSIFSSRLKSNETENISTEDQIDSIQDPMKTQVHRMMNAPFVSTYR